MNTRFTLLALALVTLATACDPEAVPTSDDASMFRDGEVIVPPTGPIGTGLVVKGGHDNPYEIVIAGYDLAPVQYQEAFHAQVLLEAHKVIADDFLANERNLVECPGICEDLDASWDEGVYVGNLAVQYGTVQTETNREGQTYWLAAAEAQADVGCGCI